MIKLHTYDKCKNCAEFEPMMMKDQYIDPDSAKLNTVCNIYCKYNDVCNRIENYIENNEST